MPVNPARDVRPPAEWDPRLRVTLQTASNCREGCWRLASARFEDSDESGGLEWRVGWPAGDVIIITKAAPEWADFPMYGEYDPDEGQAGPYWAYAGHSEATSDVVRGMGLPERQHVVFRLVWERIESGGATPVPTRTPLPTATRTVTPTRTATVMPTATVAPCVECERLYLPSVRRR